jgi:hypothetical protein
MTVVNLYKEGLKNTPQEEWPEQYVYIGRPGKGLTGCWGNPIKAVKQGLETRADLCQICESYHYEKVDTLPCFEKLLRMTVAKDEVVRDKLKGLRGKSLVCFCPSGRCHGDIIEKIVEELFSKVDEKEN